MPDYRQRLELILGAATQPPRARSLYAALAEAAEDPIVRRALQRVATARIEHLETCYRHLGSTAAEPGRKRYSPTRRTAVSCNWHTKRPPACRQSGPSTPRSFVARSSPPPSDRALLIAT